MYHFVRSIIYDILVVHTKSFSSTEEALDWNRRTEVCSNFDLMTREEIDEWKGEVIWVPIRRNSNVEPKSG